MAIKLKVSETNAILKVNTDGAVRFKTETGIPIYPDGDNIGYGITDGTIPRVGIAKVGSAQI